MMVWERKLKSPHSMLPPVVFAFFVCFRAFLVVSCASSSSEGTRRRVSFHLLAFEGVADGVGWGTVDVADGVEDDDVGDENVMLGWL